MYSRLRRISIALQGALLPLLLAACVAVPRTTEYYDEQCQVESRYMTLEAEQVGTLGGCANNDCAALLAAYGIVAAASVVVSGSVVVVGNVVYWVERRAACLTAQR
jgi:hypothetical protein